MRMTIEIHPDEQRVIRAIAYRERRATRDQAALMLRRFMEREGLLPSPAEACDATQSTPTA